MKNFSIKVDKKEYWISRSIAAVSYVYTKKDGRWYVLANKRGTGAPSNVGKWNAPSGFLDYDETIAQCAIRETYEETGVVIENPSLMEIDDDVNRDNQNVLVRYASYVDYQEPNADHCEPNEVEEVKWIPFSDIDQYDWTSKRHAERMKCYCRIIMISRVGEDV